MTAKSNRAMPWFRMYTEAVDDEKLRLLAFEDRWHFVALLCCKGQGVIPEFDEPTDNLTRRKVAVKLGLEMRAFEEAVRRIAEVGLIDPETLQPLAWEKRQARSDADPTAAERKRRQRQKQVEKEPEAQNDDSHAHVTDTSRVTPSVTSRTRHASVTPLEVDIDKEYSVLPNGSTGGEPPKVNPGEMTKEELWSASKAMLASAGMPQKQCGAFVGALVKKYGESATKEALSAALLERPADPAGYLTAACQTQSGSRKPPNKQQALEQRNREVALKLASKAA